jgi:hypothetical protein
MIGREPLRTGVGPRIACHARAQSKGLVSAHCRRAAAWHGTPPQVQVLVRDRCDIRPDARTRPATAQPHALVCLALEQRPQRRHQLIDPGAGIPARHVGAREVVGRQRLDLSRRAVAGIPVGAEHERRTIREHPAVGATTAAEYRDGRAQQGPARRAGTGRKHNRRSAGLALQAAP